MLFSIGHSNHPIEHFVSLLQGAGVTLLADVRSYPKSRYAPQFNREALRPALAESGIQYAFLGVLLGGRPAEAELYDADGRADYEKIRATDRFRRGLDRLLEGASGHVVALMCGEEDPLDCHRGLMITPALADLGRSPFHLRKEGVLESTEEMEARLFEREAEMRAAELKA